MITYLGVDLGTEIQDARVTTNTLGTYTHSPVTTPTDGYEG